MLKTISGTFASKFALALLNFATIILSTRLLGAEGRGEISFFVTNMVLVLLFTSLVGGPSLVYLTPRYNFFKFLLPTYVWAILLTVSFCCFFYLTGQLSLRDFYFLFFAVLLNSWKSTNMMILLGKEKMKAFNWLALVHSIFLILFFVAFYYPIQLLSVESFYWGIILSNLLVWLWSFWLLFDLGATFDLRIDRHLLQQLMAYGGLAQLANIIQFANYRISYYYLMNIPGAGAAAELGKYSIAVSIAESVWIIGQSLATVQFSKLSNTEDPKARKKISVRLFKLNFLLNAVAVIVLGIVPSSLYVLVFDGNEFGAVAHYITWMLPGIFALGATMSFSSYFAGKGKYWPAVFSSLAGVGFTIGICQFLIPLWGVYAAAFASSVSYCVIGLYFTISFIKSEQLPVGTLLPGIQDIRSYGRWINVKLNGR